MAHFIISLVTMLHDDHLCPSRNWQTITLVQNIIAIWVLATTTLHIYIYTQQYN